MWMLQLALLVVGFALLIKGADFMVDGASSIARRFNVSDLVIGLTVVAFGTSLPELFVNLFASARGNGAIAVGNVLGSNVANILLILGVCALIHPLAVSRGTVYKEIPFSLLAAVVLAILANDHILGDDAALLLNRADGLILLCFFAIFLYYSASIATQGGPPEGMPRKEERPVPRSLLLVAAGFVGLAGGGEIIVRSAVALARGFGMSESVIGLTIVALGTSLPELATSGMAAYRKNADIAVGNVVGSNIFNILFVLGVSTTIRPLPFSRSNNVDLLAVVVASLLLFIYMFTGARKKLDRWEGGVFVAAYAGYIGWLVFGVG
ncbi:MAG: calcium/sodium antiporter [Desulfatibacillaceae bacterium]